VGYFRVGIDAYGIIKRLRRQLLLALRLPEKTYVVPGGLLIISVRN
jgi:hypothetical protein